MHAIELLHVSLRYFTRKDEIEALRRIDLQVGDGAFVSLVGPSGCGKSTLLSLIAGMLQPTEGEVRLFGERIAGTSRRVGYMLQQDHLFEWRDVLQNVLVGAQIRGIDRREARQKALTLLSRYGLEEFARRNPRDLSGGMRQRVALIRTLVLEPDIVLLDEPFSALDFQTRLILADEMSRILREQGKTVVLVTHDIAEAITMADRVAVISNRPGMVKSVYDIRFRGGRPTPLKARETPEYQAYFRAIWEDLEHHVHV
jgi:NitT/TauT family transport system ATP-binding protein